MNAREITIRVDAKAAESYMAASSEERKKIDLLLSLRLGQVTRPSDSLERVMRETSAAAQAQGLTEKELDALLREQ